MTIDFCSKHCTEPPRTNENFGICDEQDGSKAFTTVDKEIVWNANVVNPLMKKTQFIAIDNCLSIFKENSNDLESTCDGVLKFDGGIYFLELKDTHRGGWISESIAQLANTIRIFGESTNNLSGLKKAFACNKRHPYFRKIEFERKKKFKVETDGFILDIQRDILIK